MYIVEWLSQPWHWAVSGGLIAVIMIVLLFFDKSFGMSNTMRTLCAVGGAGKKIKFFDFDWSTQKWNLLFMVGVVLGGVIASTFLQDPEPIRLAAPTLEHLKTIGVVLPEESTHHLVPSSLFSLEQLYTFKGFTFMVLGGFMVGFGARYAGGCTSGHAIAGLANLQLPSLLAVLGFFVGGIIMVHFILPVII